ncbi:hypothetical protein [Priestia megaterium]|uniref:Uncharacterized protein n=1 Tax=Priestia megaterium TaxID=1404 RepID=A0A6M6DZM0_PRIMG|nr:hypothetical protein [Priestia megaterium]QJX80343.1 hypothetical protein FDZ14_30105 [Priestia megaterium]
MTMNTYQSLDALDQLGFFTEDLQVNTAYTNQPLIYDNFNNLTPGDYIKVTLGNGYTSEGIYAFNGDRVCVKETTYFFEKKISYPRGRKQVIQGIEFAEFSEGDKVQILTRNYVPNYQLPQKSEVYPKLVEELKKVPLNERIKTYRRFCDSYPQYEVTWSRLLHDVWGYAIVEVTTPQEVEEMIMTEKNEHGRYYESFVKPFLNYVFENVEPSLRIQYIASCAWSRSWQHPMTKRTTTSVTTFSTTGMLDGVYAKLLAVTDNKKVFNKLFDVWGINFHNVDDFNLEKNCNLLKLVKEGEGLWLNKSLSIGVDTL